MLPARTRRTIRRTFAICLAGLTLTASLGACGGGGRGGGGGTRAAAPGLSLTELAARANAICAAPLSRHLPAVGLGGRSSAAAYRTAASIVDRQTKTLLTLQPAAGQAAGDWRAFTSAAVAVDRLAHADQTAAAAGRIPRTRDPGRLRLGRRLAAAATKVGATACIRG